MLKWKTHFCYVFKTTVKLYRDYKNMEMEEHGKCTVSEYAHNVRHTYMVPGDDDVNYKVENVREKWQTNAKGNDA